MLCVTFHGLWFELNAVFDLKKNQTRNAISNEKLPSPLWKIEWKKWKLFAMSTFSYALNSNKSCQPQNKLNPFPNKPWFLRVCSIGLLKTLWKKEKLLEPSNFSFSHSVFYTFEELSAIFIISDIVVC